MKVRCVCVCVCVCVVVVVGGGGGVCVCVCVSWWDGVGGVRRVGGSPGRGLGNLSQRVASW